MQAFDWAKLGYASCVTTNALLAFRTHYGNEPAVVVRAPGRVNLIGEHTDYSLLPVLPMAIDRAITIAIRAAGDGTVSANSEGFGEVTLAPGGHAPAEGWGRYVWAALAELQDLGATQGARIAITSTLPAGSGLASSAALTTGIIAGLVAAWGIQLEGEMIATRAMAAEHRLGVETGGMDQQAILFSEAGSALRIDFDPPALKLVPIPAGLAFVVASSGEAAEKTGAARARYNERVVGARLAAAMLADQVGLDIGTPPTLSEVAGVDVVDVLVDDLPEQVSAQEVAHGAQVDVERLVRLSADRLDHMAKLPVRRVARHILSEAYRVEQAEAALEAGDLRAFGRLLNESHDSLRQDFRCSTAALDRLCAAMRKAGALGARLTGAGFGGYALAACAPASVEAVVAAAVAATGGPAFEVHASAGLEILPP